MFSEIYQRKKEKIIEIITVIWRMKAEVVNQII